jgi:hypothetical protein
MEMETYSNFDPIYIKFIEEVTFNQIVRLNKNSKKIEVEQG